MLNDAILKRRLFRITHKNEAISTVVVRISARHCVNCACRGRTDLLCAEREREKELRTNESAVKMVYN